MGLLIRSSAIHAAGCYTTSSIRKGARILEYTGPLLPQKEADRLYDDKDFTYLFGVGDGKFLIDGHCMAAFLNHSCDPNCETDEVKGRVWIFALRDIKPGEELCYDYNLYDGIGDATCNCGAGNCRGTMYSPEEIRKRERQQARKRQQSQKKAKQRKQRQAHSRNGAERKPAKTACAAK
ncbi:MAG: SET domain-containing protein-lysine N-methyltransferase [Candidatus Korobacteraceae bacterium]